MLLIDETSGDVIADDVRAVNNPISRLVGLLARKSVAASEGIWLANCPAVHTMGMRATIDLIFLDGENRVLGVSPNAVPNRPYFSFRGAKTVVELGAGSRAAQLQPGHVLKLAEA